MSLYTHPNMDDLDEHTLLDIVKNRQNQRLLVAIEAHKLRQAKIEKLNQKDQDKFTSVGNRLVTRLAKIEKDLQLCEDDIATMTKLRHSIALYKDELNA